jgi:hypothetical protein
MPVAGSLGGVAAVVGLALMAASTPWAGVALVVVLAGVLTGIVGWLASDRPGLPRILTLPAFGLMGNVAAMHAGLRVLRGDQDALWAPTRRVSTPGE